MLWNLATHQSQIKNSSVPEEEGSMQIFLLGMEKQHIEMLKKSRSLLVRHVSCQEIAEKTHNDAGSVWKP